MHVAIFGTSKKIYATEKITSELKKQNKCILVSSHQLNLIENICDKLAIISYSKLVYFGTLSDLKKEKGGKKLYITFPADISEEDSKLLSYLNKISDGEYETGLTENSDFKKVLSDIMERKLEITSLQIKELSLNDIFIKWEESK